MLNILIYLIILIIFFSDETTAIECVRYAIMFLREYYRISIKHILFILKLKYLKN